MVRADSSVVRAGGLLIAALLAGLIVWVAVSRAQPAPHSTALDASGGLQVFNSKDGGAILNASQLLPGGSTTGTVTIANSGNGGGRFHLTTSAVAETPGIGGGRLSQRLQLEVDDITHPSRRITVFTGSLLGLQNVDLGALSAGEERDYQFTVTFPNGGPNGADNAYQRATLQATFLWTVTAASGAGAGSSSTATTTATTTTSSTPTRPTGTTTTPATRGAAGTAKPSSGKPRHKRHRRHHPRRQRRQLVDL
jgi:hypothetical protein